MMVRYKTAWLLVIGVLGSLVLVGVSAFAQTETPLPDFPTATPSQAAITPDPNLPTPTVLATQTLPRNGRIVETTCHAEPKWSFLINVRRGPSTNWGVVRQFLHDDENHEFFVFGRDEEWEWYHVVLPEPYEDTVGWIRGENANIYGNCVTLPNTEDTPELTIEDVPDPSEPITLPTFVDGQLNLTIYDRVFSITDGVIYIRREVPGEEKERLQGHVLLFDYRSSNFSAGVTIGAQADVGGVPVSAMARANDAFAAITGDFYAGNYYPQGITVIDNEVITAPKFRSAFGISTEGEPFIGYFTTGWTWGAYVTATNGEVIPLQLMNVPCETGWLCLYSHHRENRVPERYRGIRVLLNEDYEVEAITEAAGGTEVPDGYYVLRGEGGPAEWLLENVAIGDQLELTLPTDPAWQDFESVISGGPRLLLDGEFWEDCDPTLDPPVCEEFSEDFRERHYGLSSLPRTAVGFNDEGIIYAVVVEGYEVDDSGGATRRELAELMLDFGAEQAMEFDGGGSASMYLMPNGAISDFGWEGERPVTNSLLFFWDD